MPYAVKKNGKCGASKPYAVVEDETNDVMGCHETEQEANAQLAALYTSEPEIQVESDSLGAWEGILAIEGVETGDGREFSPGSLSWAEMPLPLSWQKQSSSGHTGSVGVGRIDEIWRDKSNPAVIRGKGVFDLQNDDGKEAHRQVGAQFLRGTSIDVDKVKNADIETVFPENPNADKDVDDNLAKLFGMPAEKTIYHKGRIRGTTLVSLPAFVEAQVWLAETPTIEIEIESETASGVGTVSSAVWNGSAHERRLAPRVSYVLASKAFAYVSGPKSDTVHKSAGLFLHHEIDKDGNLGAANINACLTAIGVLQSSVGDDFPLGDRHLAYAHLAGHVRDSGMVPQPFSVDSLDAVTACACEDDAPPREWFDDPKLTHPVGMTVTPDGHIFGHAALFDTCHIGVQNSCVRPPIESRHDYFMLGEVITAGGEDQIAVGTITLGTGHAPTHGITAQQAVEHYDNTGTAVADVVVGNDEFGIWVSGAVRPNLPPGRLAELRTAKLSGDWRRIGGKLRLVALLAVNVPGFPVPRMATRMTEGRQLALVASGMLLTEETDSIKEELTKLRNELKETYAKRVNRDLTSRMLSIRNRVHV